MESKGLLPILNYIIGMFDPYGVGHAERVCDLSVKLAIRSGINRNSKEIPDIEFAATLHDIGKVGIPEWIRRHPGKFLPAERLLMEQHTIIGEKILRLAMNGKINDSVCRIERSHHENWAGDGYPDKLKGEEIPFGARIIRICDFFDALTHVRGYQSLMRPAQALQYMNDEQIRVQWADPELFRLFNEMIRESL